MKLGDVISKMRRQKLISGIEMAERAKISANYLSLIENNRKLPSGDVLDRIAVQLGIPVSSLLFSVLEEQDFVKPRHRKMFNEAKPLIDKILEVLLNTGDKNN